ncbi:MAG: acyl-CoA thioesterase [Actinomycetota bacterium]|nr:acyl-CoA thioesterase [Actinomycetota bacterium]
MSDWPFVHTDRVRYADVDSMRHLNNVAFVRFFESARIAFMREVFPEHDPTDPAEFPVVLAETSIAYRSPAYYDDEVRTQIRPAELQRSSFRTAFRMHVGDRLIADGYGVYVGYDYVAERAQPLTDKIVAGLQPLIAG